MPLVTFGLSKNLDAPSMTPEFLGGKGYSLVRMSEAGIPVPPGFIIPVPSYKTYAEGGMEAVVANIQTEVNEALARMIDDLGYKPLVSVRSGAPVSMPGMMDTVLNVGITPQSIDEFSERYPKWVVLDCLRRFVMMFGESVRGIPFEIFNQAIKHSEEKYGSQLANFNEKQMGNLCSRLIKVYGIMGKGFFPDKFRSQLLECIEAVYKSWNGERAIEYRKIHGIDPEMGTAVVVQAMVFGNASPKDSCSGVVFSRNPVTGEKHLYGDLLYNAQGEDVVSGKYDTLNIHDVTPPFYDDLVAHAKAIEQLYKDMVDIEFTVEKGELYILQARSGKRSSTAAFKIATDIKEKNPKVSLKKIVRRYVNADHVQGMSATTVTTKSKPSCHGIAVGGGAFSGQFAVKGQSTKGKIFVAKDTTPDDLTQMNNAAAILTTTGGSTSHAAVVARAMGKPCVVGCTEIEVSGKDLFYMGYKMSADTTIALDGATGRVWVGSNADVKISQGINPMLWPFVREWTETVLKNRIKVRASTALRDKILDAYKDDQYVDVLLEIDTMDDEVLKKAIDYVRALTIGNLYYSFRPNSRPDEPVFMGLGFNFFKGRVQSRYQIKAVSDTLAGSFHEFHHSILSVIGG